MIDVDALLRACAPGIEQGLATRLIRQESGFNPYAIGLDGKAVLKEQPQSLEDAVRVARSLVRQGKKFSIGLAQVHINNVRRLKLTWSQAFDPCLNVGYGQTILKAFYAKAEASGLRGDEAVLAALRGYNSGNIYASVSQDYAITIATGYKVKMRTAYKTSLSQSRLQKRETFDFVGEFFTTDQ